jgi:hypothetical protein
MVQADLALGLLEASSTAHLVPATRTSSTSAVAAGA